LTGYIIKKKSRATTFLVKEAAASFAASWSLEPSIAAGAALRKRLILD
jgi:hypothetical protein